MKIIFDFIIQLFKEVLFFIKPLFVVFIVVFIICFIVFLSYILFPLACIVVPIWYYNYKKKSKRIGGKKNFASGKLVEFNSPHLNKDGTFKESLLKS